MEKFKILFNIYTVLWTLFICQSTHGANFTDPNFYKIESIWTSSTGEKFKLCRISSNGSLQILKEKKIKIQFKEDSSEVSEKYKKNINRFFQNLPKNTYSLKITAHSDSCGDADYNASLAQRRGLSVYNLIQDKIPYGIKIFGVNNGENLSHGHISHDKFVEIIAEYWINDEEFTKIVLFDISGSLHKLKIGHTSRGYTLEGLKKIKLPEGTISFVPRDIRYNCEGSNLADYSPIGEDFYWEAMTLISTSIQGNARGKTYTDDTDPNGRKKERIFNSKNTGKVRWEIH